MTDNPPEAIDDRTELWPSDFWREAADWTLPGSGGGSVFSSGGGGGYDPYASLSGLLTPSSLTGRSVPLALVISTAAFRCRWLTLNALAQARPFLHERGDPRREVEAPDLWARLNQPMPAENPDFDLLDMILFVGSNMLEQGEAHIWIPEDRQLTRTSSSGGGIPRAIYPLPVKSVQPQQGANDGFFSLSHWSLVDPITGAQLVRPKDEVVLLRYLDNPRSNWFGIGPVESASGSIETDALGAWAINNALRKGGLPGVLMLIAKQGTNQKELNAYLAEFRKQLQSARDKTGVTGIAGDIQTETLSQTAQEMQTLEQRRYATEEVCRAHGIPVILVSQPDTGQLGREMMSVARETAYFDAFIPFGNKIARRLSRGVVQRFEPGLELGLDWSACPALQALLAVQADTARKFWDMAMPFAAAADLAGLPSSLAFDGAQTAWIDGAKKPVVQAVGELGWQREVAAERGVANADAVAPAVERLVDPAAVSGVLEVRKAYQANGFAERSEAVDLLVSLFGLSAERADRVLGPEPPPPPAEDEEAETVAPPVPGDDTEDPRDDTALLGDEDDESRDAGTATEDGNPSMSPRESGPEKTIAAMSFDAALSVLRAGDFASASEMLDLERIRRAVAEKEARKRTVHAATADGPDVDRRTAELEEDVEAAWRQAVNRQVRAVDAELWRRAKATRSLLLKETASRDRYVPLAESSALDQATIQDIAYRIDPQALAADLMPALMAAHDAGVEDSLVEAAQEFGDDGPSGDLLARQAARRAVGERETAAWALDVANELRVDVVRLLTELSGERASTKEISTALMADMRGQVLMASAADLPIETAAKAKSAREETRKLSKMRAGRAREQAFKRYNRGRIDALVEAHAEKDRVPVFRWKSQGDDGRTRATHLAIDGVVRPYGESFVDYAKLVEPYDPDAPIEETANCRCYLVRVGSVNADEIVPDSAEDFA